MQYLMGLVRRCIEDYDMISPGDRIALGLSGGKDSIALLCAMAGLRKYYPVPYELEAITLDMGAPGMDFSGVKELCSRLDVPYTLVPTQMYQVIFEDRKETNPCSLCAKMRRGALNNAALARGCKKVALAHNHNDAVETFLLSLLFEGRISCFQPVTYLDRTGVTQIRPMLYAGEGTALSVARRYHLPVVHNTCPANGDTKRQEVKELTSRLEKEYPDLKEKIFRAMQRLPLDHWQPRESRRRPLPEEPEER